MKNNVRTNRSTRPHRVVRAVVLAIFLIGAVTACASAGGSREKTPAEPPTTPGPVTGTIVALDSTDAGDQLVTVERADGSRVFVEVPERLAASLRLQIGDVITSEEHRETRDGERVRVQRLNVERG
ncbi:MAG: hypothetical protein PF508_09060 [Spirochaeta sp.]|jgi:uncharacterized membrane protein|nr:hypothetical protein [Spirochaeta sp.]